MSVNNCDFVGFEFLTAVVIKSSIFWDIMPYSSLKLRLTFNGLHGVISEKIKRFNCDFIFLTYLDITCLPHLNNFPFIYIYQYEISYVIVRP
jgi:hypothetical protein